MSRDPPPQISSEYLDIGRQRVYPGDCLRTSTGRVCPVIAVQHTPTRGVILDSGGDWEFVDETSLIDSLAEGTVHHWRQLARESTISTEVDNRARQFVCYMYATDEGTGSFSVWTGVGLLAAEDDPSPGDMDEWATDSRIEFSVRAFEQVPEWLRRDADLVQTISRVLWEATETAVRRNLPELLETDGIDNPHR